MHTFQIKYGGKIITIDSPVSVDACGMKPPKILQNPAASIRYALENPFGKPSLAGIARAKICANINAAAVIVVSDFTRPVPYAGENGILGPILGTLRSAGFSDSSITILIGTGSHSPMQPDHARAMLGIAGVDRDVKIVNHEYDNHEALRYSGKTQRGSSVWINRHYAGADLKIVTGLVESHFMAGVSGGRKGICPAIVGRETLEIFHGPHLLSSPRAADLVLENNPVSDESLAVAKMAGCDFLVNVTIDSDKNLTGIFCGDLEIAHSQAVEKIREYISVPIEHEYDIVVAPGSYVAVNHYQSCKTAVQAAAAVRPGGTIILLGEHPGAEPVGGRGYKECLRLLKLHGYKRFVEMLFEPGWRMIQEQWQVQMWCRVFEKIGLMENLVYCCLDIDRQMHDELLPGSCGMALLQKKEQKVLQGNELVKTMIERALARAAAATKKPSVAFLPDGPYGIVMRQNVRS